MEIGASDFRSVDETSPARSMPGLATTCWSHALRETRKTRPLLQCTAEVGGTASLNVSIFAADGPESPCPRGAAARPHQDCTRTKSELHAQDVSKLADDAAAEQKHADDEDRALDHEYPLPDRGQVILERHHEEGTHDRPE